MSENPEISLSSQTVPEVTTCSQCNSPMPFGLRFCRNCGFRLGEGSAEYTETVRFQNSYPVAGPLTAASHQPLETTQLSPGAGFEIGRRRRRLSGMTWMFLGLMIFFVGAGVFTSLISRSRPRIPVVFGGAPATPRSYVGVSGFESTDGGVTFDSVEPPGSPADLAGLVGGDIITSFDGQSVGDEDSASEIVRNTPIGKSVEVSFIRDGQTMKTRLTTISKGDFDRLAAAFRNRPEGRAQFGYDDDEAEKVPIPGTKLFGVRLGEILSSRPADLFGIKNGDIVIEFDKVPIRTTEELLSRVRRAVPYSTVDVVVIRDGQQLKIPVKMGKQ